MTKAPILTALPPSAGRVSTAWTSVATAATLKRAIHLRRLVGTLDARNTCGKIDNALDNHNDSSEYGVRSVDGFKFAGRDAGDSDDEAGDAQNKIDEGKDFECLARGAHR